MVYSCDTRNPFHFEVNSCWVLELLNDLGWEEPEDYDDFETFFMSYCIQIEKKYNSYLCSKQYPASFIEWFIDNYNDLEDMTYWEDCKLVEKKMISLYGDIQREIQ